MNYLISITGKGATGKTIFAKELSAALQMPMISMDEIKETIFDRIGEEFDEKIWHAVSPASFDLMFDFAEKFLSSDQSVIIESNLQNNENNILQVSRILRESKAKLIQIEFITEGEERIRRFNKRLESVHFCHRKAIENIGFDKFQEKLKNDSLNDESMMLNISVSSNFTVDTTDLPKANYNNIISKIGLSLK